jgi:hydroxymethylbilane synthase
MPNRKIKIGTRGSRLALAQTDDVIGLLRAIHPDINFEKVIVKTEGDIDRSSSLDKIGGIGLFTKQIETALLDGTIDVAVHSAKDLPSQMTDGLTIGAVPIRVDNRDVWIARNNIKFTDIPSGARVGTGSPRRVALILNKRPDLMIENIRGNIETRLKKLDDGQYDALIMAYAGLKRTRLENKITETLSREKFIPAAGQGALVVQVRQNDVDIINVVQPIDDPVSHRCLSIERLLLFGLQAGCSAPVGGWARIENNRIKLSAVVLDKNGKRRLNADNKSDIETSDNDIVDDVIGQLYEQGAEELIAAYR